MKSFISLLIALLTFHTVAQSQTDFTNTGTLIISSLSDTLFVSTNFNNTGTAAFTNNGGMYVKGNISNSQAAMPAVAGTLFLTGAATQSINGTAVFKTFNLSALNNAGINLAQDLSVLNNFTLAAGAFDISSYNLKVGGSITSNGNIGADSATVELNGSLAQVVPAAAFTFNAVKNLAINNTAGVALAGAVNLTNELFIKNGSLSSGGYLTLKSSAASTARVATITSNAAVPVSGNVTVEKYMMSKRAYRFLTPAVNTTESIKANWMENTNNPSPVVNNNPMPGFGMHITGSGGYTNGFDASNTNNPSLFSFNPVTQAWVAATTTTTPLYAGAGYRVLVRGSRSTDLSNNNPTPSPAVLRSTGTLATGTLIMAKPSGGGTAGMPALTEAVNGYTLIGNPYASPIDWLTIPKTNISTSFYIFDPTISGVNGRGAYITYNSILGVNNNSASNIDNNIQQGQAFFIQTTGPNPLLTFRETDKSTFQRNVMRGVTQMPGLSVQLLLPQQLGNTNAADGFLVYFDDAFDNSIGSEDSYKFQNVDENICINRNGSLLSIEGRKLPTSNDSIPFKMWQLTLPTYYFRIAAQHFADSIEVYLKDSWLNTTERLFNDSTAVFPFSITTDTASLSPNRFSIVFNVATTLPLQLIRIKAYEKNKGVQVEWTAQAEISMNRYEVEVSANARDFSKISAVNAKANPGASSEYQFYNVKPLIGDNFYRIRSVSNSGVVKYSEVAKVVVATAIPSVKVYPNPVKGNRINLLFSNKEMGFYNVKLMNNAGQSVHSTSLLHTGNSASHIIALDKKIAKGAYTLLVSFGIKSEAINVVIE